MAKRLTYADAIRLLGGTGPTADLALGGLLLAGTAAGVPGVLGLFDAKTELVRVGRTLLTGLNDRVRGLGRLDRTTRLHAAHTVIVITAYFEAFDLVEAGLTREDQLRLAGAGRSTNWIDDLLTTTLPEPTPDTPYDVLLRDLTGWYAELSSRFALFLTGLAVWDALDETARDRTLDVVHNRLPAEAIARYEILHRTLAADVIEFRLWTRALDDRARLHTVTRGLADLEKLLRQAVSAREPERRRAALAAWYRAELDEPILTAEGLPPGLRLPALAEIYLDPVYRVRPAGPGDRPSEEDWWSETDPHDDLPSFLAGYLTTPHATVAPLVVLGQPGAGKSALTRVIAARLPAADFVPVRVPLREVPADIGLQDQIEYALRAATGDATAWPELVAGDEGGALPVVMLDGFDELLQATGVSRSDFLEQVAAFQRREAVQRRPVAVIVTSRIAVADRARLPLDSTVLRLEPFTPAQVSRWLDVWRDANTAALAGRGLRSLPAEVANQLPDLSGQPLLLLMLALYDAEANDVQDGEQLDAAALYERLLRSYAEREVRKGTDGATEALVEEELERLSVAAFAMFNRGQQWVTVSELDADIAALGIGPSRRVGGAGFRAPLTAGQELLGRFFFIQNAQAIRDGKSLQTYEFLHATFGEFLIARLVVRILGVVLARESVAGLLLRPATAADDGLLATLLTYAPLTDRGAVLGFLHSAIGRTGDAERFAPLCVRAFRAVAEAGEVPATAYRPRHLIAADRQAVCALNLLLLTLACGPVAVSDLFPDAEDPVNLWRCWIERWQAAVGSDSWGTFNSTVSVRRGWSGPERQMTVVMGGEPVPEPVDAYWMEKVSPDGPGRRYVGFRFGDDQDFRRTYDLRCHPMDSVLLHAVEPLLDTVGPALNAFGVVTEEDCPSAAHVLTAVWLASESRLPLTYERAMKVVSRCWAPARLNPPPDYTRAVTASMSLLLRHLSRDAHRLPPADVDRWARLAVTWEYARIEHSMWALDCVITAALADPDVRHAGFAGLRDICRELRQHHPAPAWEGTLAVRVWTGLHLLGAGDDAEGIFGDRDAFLAIPAVADALRRDPRLAIQIDAAAPPHG